MKLKALIVTVLAALAVMAAGIFSHAVESRGTEAEAKALVKKAVEYMKSAGNEKAFEEFSNPDGKFADRDLYVFVYDMDGKVVAHGQNLKMIGKNMLDAKDADGKEFVKERIAIAKGKGSGWQEYKFRDPITKQIADKKAYIEKAGNYIVGCGVYK